MVMHLANRCRIVFCGLILATLGRVFSQVHTDNSVRLFYEARVLEEAHTETHGIGSFKFNQSESRSLRARHNGMAAIGNENNVAENIVITLPRTGDVTIRRKYYTPIGGRIGEPYKVWHGLPIVHKAEDTIFKSHSANFVLLPNGEMICSIQIHDKKYECKPCSVSKWSKNKDQSCIDITEIESISTFPPELTRSVPIEPSKSIMEQLTDNRKLTGIELQRELFEHGSPKLDFDNTVDGVNGRYLAEELDDGSVIDVMMLYTQAVVDRLGSEDIVRATIAAAVAQNNDAYITSMIELEAQIVGWGLVDYVETGDVGFSLDYISFDPVIARMRDSFGADLVTLITVDGDIQMAMGMTTLSCGIGWTPNPTVPETEAYGFSAVDFQCMVYNLSVPHEWGHNFGCDHDFQNSAQDRLISYAYGYHNKTCEYHTIMSYPCVNSRRQPIYSNPSLKIADTGEAMGSKKSAFCSQVINDYRLNVSQFRATVASDVTSAPTSSPTSIPPDFPSIFIAS